MNPATNEVWTRLFEQFRRVWSDEAAGVGVVVGCSGGADSVALVRLIDAAHRHYSQANQAPPLIIAHFNHGLRGNDSIQDEAHARGLAEQVGRPFVAQSGLFMEDGKPTQIPVTDEASLRDARRSFFVETAHRYGCRYIALGHTADDQAETVLHRILRGTGSAGAAGMQAFKPIDDDLVICRPLLSIRRAFLREAMRLLNQSWREDQSNQDSLYTRNWIRHQVMPILRERFPSVDESLIRMAENQSQTDQLLARLGEEWMDAFVSSSGNADGCLRIRIRTHFADKESTTSACRWSHDRKLATDPAIITRALQLTFHSNQLSCGHMSQMQWRRLCDLITNQFSPECPSAPRGSFGHLPGRIEMIVASDAIELVVGRYVNAKGRS